MDNKAISKAKKLLLEYRPTLWRKMAIEATVGTKGEDFQSCVKNIEFVKEAVQKLRNHRLLGDKLYWIIYITYMTEKQPKENAEILLSVAEKCGVIPRSSYFRLRNQAIDMIDRELGVGDDRIVSNTS